MIENLMLCPVDVLKALDLSGRDLGAANWEVKNNMNVRDIKQLVMENRDYYSLVIFNFEILTADYYLPYKLLASYCWKRS